MRVSISENKQHQARHGQQSASIMKAAAAASARIIGIAASAVAS